MVVPSNRSSRSTRSSHQFFNKHPLSTVLSLAFFAAAFTGVAVNVALAYFEHTSDTNAQTSFVGQLLISWFDVEPQSPVVGGVLAFLFSVAIMYGYTRVVFRFAIEQPDPRRDTRFQNSLYFLGFIFTLSALAVSIFSIALTLEASNVDAEGTNAIKKAMKNIIIQNGLALFSTIAGIMGRNWFAYRHPAEDHLSLDDLVQMLGPSNKVVKQAVDTWGQLNPAISAVTTTVDQQRQNWDHLAVRMAKFDSDIDNANSIFDQKLTATMNYWKALHGHVSNLQASFDQIHARMAATTSSMSQLPAATDAATLAIKKDFETMAKLLTTVLSDAQAHHTDYLETLEKMNVGISGATTASLSAFKWVRAAVDKTIEELRAATGAVDENSQGMQKSSDELRKHVEAATSALEELNKEIRALVADSAN